MRAALSDVRAGRTATLLIGGEASIGKSRLMERFTSEAAEAGKFVAMGGCPPSVEATSRSHPSSRLFGRSPVGCRRPKWTPSLDPRVPLLPGSCPAQLERGTMTQLREDGRLCSRPLSRRSNALLKPAAW